MIRRKFGRQPCGLSGRIRSAPGGIAPAGFRIGRDLGGGALEFRGRGSPPCALARRSRGRSQGQAAPSVARTRFPPAPAGSAAPGHPQLPGRARLLLRVRRRSGRLCPGGSPPAPVSAAPPFDGPPLRERNPLPDRFPALATLSVPPAGSRKQGRAFPASGIVAPYAQPPCSLPEPPVRVLAASAPSRPGHVYVPVPASL
jgi:hypothetical protein